MTPKKVKSSRIFGLDVFRAIAILLVVFGHGSFLLKGTILEGFPYIRMIDGVDLFFVLSGFLIGNILLKKINKSNTFKINDLIHFWKRRWFRTLPNYYLILLLNYIFVKNAIIHEDITQFNVSFLVFLHNFKEPFYGFFWESWSLSVEEWFYIFMPLLIVLLIRLLSPKKAFLSATLIMIILPVVYRYSIYNPGIDGFTWDIVIRKTVLCRLDSIGYGLFAAWGYYYHQNLWTKFKVQFFLLGAALVVFIINCRFPNNTVYKQVFYFSTSPLAAMLLLPLFAHFKNGVGKIANAITHISKISYSMYLLNLAIVAEVIRDNLPPSTGQDGIFKYILYWIIVLIGASLLYKYFEKPMMNLRDRI